MKIIGLDFGTTNSTISYYNPVTRALDGFRHGAAGNDYIPTVIAYNKNKADDIVIGSVAKNGSRDRFEVYEHFKLRLGKNFDDVIEGKTKTPNRVAHDFIKKLLDVYKSGQRIDDIEGIVMTVPETWFREESNRTARENIEGIFKELGYGGFKFLLESEPVAAAAYFCWAYEFSESNPNKKKYNGYITVIDYGGGTLDVTLCEAKNGKEIRVLERCGFGEYNETNGCAGVAFDEAVTEKLIRDNKLDIPKDSSKFIALRNEFEEQKILNYEKTTEGMKYFYDDPAIMENDPLFSVEDRYGGKTINVYCEDLDECFNKVNAEKLKNSLKKIKQFFPAHKIDSSAQDNFKVLLVGGFSNFFVVEKEVREFFGSGMESLGIDKRFEQLSIQNRALAISRGAALIAAEEIKSVHTCTHSYGYIVKSLNDSDEWVDKYVSIIEKGADIKTLSEPKFAAQAVEVMNKAGKLRIFIDDGQLNNAGRLRVALDESVKELFPSVDDNVSRKKYWIGFSVNKNQIPTIHIKDALGSIKSTSLNKLLESMAIVEK